jgi:hemoglobin
VADNEPHEVETTLYQRLGDARIRALVDRFYDHMDTDPACATIRAMHPDLDRARDKLYWFLVGWAGGPQLYVERFGHPRLRARHMPFSIGDQEALEWMHAMRLALAETVPEPHLRSLLEASLGRIAGHMRNRDA